MTVLWGCAFEDFVSSGSGERNVADEYLKRRGWKESAGARAYIRALRTSVMSLYEVSDVVVGESFLARDLVRGGEPVRVFERSATRGLSQWDRIAARVVTVLGKTQISGAVLPFSHPLAEEAVASIERVRKKARAEAGKLAKSLGRNVDEIDFAAVTGLEEVLASSAFMFSKLWLNDALRRSLNPTLPQIENTDGDPLEFITVHFPLISKAKLQAIRTALDDLPSLWKESDGFWNWIEAKAPPRKAAKRRSTAAQTFGATMDDGAIVLGTIELGTKTVTLSVNSEARRPRARNAGACSRGTRARSPRRAAEHRTDDGVIAGAFGTGHRSPPAGRGAKHRSSGPDGSLSRDPRRADPGARRPDAAQGGQDCERPEEGDRVAEDAGEPISAAASRGSDGRLRLHVAGGENSALATSGGDRIETGRSAMRKGSASGAAHGERAPVSWAKTAPRPRLPPRRSPPT